MLSPQFKTPILPNELNRLTIKMTLRLLLSKWQIKNETSSNLYLTSTLSLVLLAVLSASCVISIFHILSLLWLVSKKDRRLSVVKLHRLPLSFAVLSANKLIAVFLIQYVLNVFEKEHRKKTGTRTIMTTTSWIDLTILSLTLTGQLSMNSKFSKESH